MQATLGCLSRLVSRSLVSGVANAGGNCKESAANQVDQARLVTAVSGFPKAKAGYNIDNILKGQIGDDAYFVARHLDDWSSEQLTSSDREVLCPSSEDRDPRTCSTPASPASGSSSPNSGVPVGTSPRIPVGADVIGVADGVGGWRQYGIDPGQFSTHLMKNCERLVTAGYFSPTQPARLLAQSFREMQDSKAQVVGSSTACVLMLSHSDAKIYTANMGDSGFMVVRGGQVVHRSSEQQHFFNTPFQLSLPPSELAADVLADAPESADRYEFAVEDGDVIMLATDGVFDNVPDSLLLAEITEKVPRPTERWPSMTTSVSPPSSSSSPPRADSRSLRPSASSSTVSSMSSSSSSSSLLGECPEDDPSCADLAANLQQCANSLALIARQLSQDPHFMSPFAKNATAAGFHMLGGKEDDITVLLAAVRLREGAYEEPRGS